MSQPPDTTWSEDAAAPLHGFHGDRTERPRLQAPGGLTIALSREAGARGAVIARLVGERLGWPVYDQEQLEFLSQDPVARDNLLDDLSPACVQWFEQRLAELHTPLQLEVNPALAQLVRLIVGLGARGEAVILGRGAGYVLPRRSTLNIRAISPLPERIAYMSQRLRLPAEEAARKVAEQDARRLEFVRTQLRQPATEIHHYDLLLNTSFLGEETCAELVVQAAKLRWEQLHSA
jgi:cytidylate kinase